MIAAAQQGYLMDPAPAPFRRWDGGFPLRAWGGRIDWYRSVFCRPYQLLALRPVRGLIDAMTCSQTAGSNIRRTLDPVTPGEASALNGCRQLAVALSAVDMRYLPEILRVAHSAGEWEMEDPGLSAFAPRIPWPGTRAAGHHGNVALDQAKVHLIGHAG